jgi:hypothetical protein
VLCEQKNEVINATMKSKARQGAPGLADCFAIFGFIAAAVNDLPALRRFVGR